ncbi:MAG: LysR family transcriptional regulator [Clostridium sp.]
MNIKHAQYMLTVMQEGSITAAAKKLYISQPSLSRDDQAGGDQSRHSHF